MARKPTSSPRLLTRNAFREAVFTRDGHRCVVCGEPAKDAHHIMERRLWPDGGYYADNGASVCEPCHLKAGSTEIGCEELRDKCGIERILLPPHLYPDSRYDLWGNLLLDNGYRLPGELFQDESVQKILGPVLYLFRKHVKYPRTYHLPWSPGATRDDRIMEAIKFEGHHVVVTEKMDGENTTFYNGFIHARALDYVNHPSRGRVKALHDRVQRDIPEGWRVCGENLTAIHSIRYEELPSFFLVFSIWDQYNRCLSWGDTIEYAEMLGLRTVPVLYEGVFDETAIRALYDDVTDREKSEGYVVRVSESFPFRKFRDVVGKFVRAGHVQTTHGHWYRREIEFQKLSKDV